MRYRFFLQLFFVSICALKASARTADEILKATDDVRNPAESYVMRVAVTDSADGTRYEFEVSIKGKEKTLIKTILPKREEGKMFLMLGEDMWVSIPSLKRSVRVSLSQKLVGEAANGDISRMRWWGDYDAKIERDAAASWTLDLKARKKGLTYDRIRLQVEKDGDKPLRAQFLTTSGKDFKSIVYKSFKQLAGRLRPTEMEITNTTTKVKSVIEILNVQVKDLPDSLFNQNNLR